MKNINTKSRGLGNKHKTLKPFPKIPESRNIKLGWVAYEKLRLIKTKFEFADFNSTVEYLISVWRKNK